jgi:serine/threonine protein phosphatase PrpC
MQFEAAGFTDKGQVREQNEDAILVDAERGLFVVADGCGGHAAGEVASSQVVETLRSLAGPLAGAGLDGERRRVLDLLGAAVHSASSTIYERGQATPQLLGMATTATVLLLRGGCAYVAHVGDTRLYRARDGRLLQLTDDHTLAAEMVKRGVLQPEEIRTWAYRNALQRALGHHQQVQVDTYLFEVEETDILLLCSDGLHGAVEDEEIFRHLKLCDERGALQTAQRLVELANEAGGVDNASAVVVRLLPRAGTGDGPGQ